MPTRPRITSKITQFRNAVIAQLLRPLRWFSPTTQLILGFVILVALETLLLSRPLLGSKTILVLALVFTTYFVLWKVIQYRGRIVRQRISKRRVFALVGTAILFESMMIRFGFIVAGGLASQSGTPPLNDVTTWSYAIPFAAATLLVAMLLDRMLGLIAGVIVSILLMLIAPQPTQLAAYSLVSCIAAAGAMKTYRERQTITLAGLLVASANCISVLALLSFSHQHARAATYLISLGAAISSGLLTIIFASGGVPIYEPLFGILTDVRLLELSNADLPLLSQLAMRAPGTNQHSHAVGQLAEDACRAIGTNGLLARVGALYHDIGKIAAPDHFVENQIRDNPHDRLRPQTSSKIIISHVTYGLRLAREIGLPEQVADFIPQHHGTRTLHFFFRKAEVEAAAKGEAVNESEFRYPGPKPQFKEAAILMLADSCEAAARSLAYPDAENISAIVERIFDAVRADGQLDESGLKNSEIDSIREALIKSLAAIYHPRIDYPGFNIESEPSTINVASKSQRTYEQASQVPINASGEVEDEAVGDLQR